MKQINYLFKVYSWISFDTLCIHLWNHHFSGDNQHSHHPQKLPLAPLGSLPPPLPILSQPLVCFLSLEIILHFLEFYVNGITECVRFCLASFTQRILRVTRCRHPLSLVPSRIPLQGPVAARSSTHLLTGLRAVSGLWLFQVKLLWTSIQVFVWRYAFHFSWMNSYE